MSNESIVLTERTTTAHCRLEGKKSSSDYEISDKTLNLSLQISRYGCQPGRDQGNNTTAARPISDNTVGIDGQGRRVNPCRSAETTTFNMKKTTMKKSSSQAQKKEMLDSTRRIENRRAGSRINCPDRRIWPQFRGLMLVLAALSFSCFDVQAQNEAWGSSFQDRSRMGNRDVQYCVRSCRGCGCVQNESGHWWRKNVVGGKAVWDACYWNEQCAATGGWRSAPPAPGVHRISAKGVASSGGVQASPSQAERLPGEYVLSGSLGEESYSGTLSIKQAGPAYALDWTIGEETYLGIGLLQGNRLTTVIGDNASCTVTAYQRDISGRLDGLWVAAGIADTGSEIAFPDNSTGSSLGDSYYVHGVMPDGRDYEGPLRVRQGNEALSFDWDTYQGVGIQRESQITVIATSDPEAECMVGMYQIASDGTLHGNWGWANARQVLLDGTEVATPQKRMGSAGGTFTVTYGGTSNADFQNARQLFDAYQVFESLAQGFSESLVLPHDVPVFVTECGFANAYYDPYNHRIVMCYEQLAEFAAMARDKQLQDVDLTEFVIGAGSAFLIHEIGHALVEILDLPITGREEDAVDDLATTTLLGLGQNGILAAYSYAGYWGQWGDEFSGAQWGEHSLPLQRMYRAYCLIYGSDSQNHGHLLETLPSDKAARCSAEYERASSSWARILGPHLRSSK